MLRLALIEILLFLAPFILYALYLWGKRKTLGDIDNWRGPLPWLAAGGLLITVAALVNLAADRTSKLDEPYQPARIRDGQFEPGS